LEKVGGFGLADCRCLQICRGHVLIAAERASLTIRHLRRHHCPLAFAQMPALEIQRDDETDRIGAPPQTVVCSQRQQPQHRHALGVVVLALSNPRLNIWPGAHLVDSRLQFLV